MKISLAIIALAATLPFSAAALAAAPFATVDKTGPETAARHLTGKELGDILQKGMTPENAYSTMTLTKHDAYEIHTTSRDKSGGSEFHANWSDHIFIQEGEASFIIGGVMVDAKETAPGEKRGTGIQGGTTMALLPGDYVFIPPGTPHQMVMKPGQRVTFIGIRTHK